jgi:hypothetical protein
VSISTYALPVNEKTLRNHEVQVVLRPRHRDIEQATLLLHFLGSAGAKIGWDATVSFGATNDFRVLLLRLLASPRLWLGGRHDEAADHFSLCAPTLPHRDHVSSSAQRSLAAGEGPLLAWQISRLHDRSDATLMALATHLLKWPRTSAALGFGAAGTALSLLWWSPVIFQSRNLLPFVLFIGVPGLSAAIAGCLFGKSLLDWPPSQGPRIAALRGAVIASVALLLFAPLFATVYIWTSPPNEHWNVLGLTLMLLLGSAVAVWWLAIVVGALVGWTLFRLASLGFGRRR